MRRYHVSTSFLPTTEHIYCYDDRDIKEIEKTSNLKIERGKRSVCE